MSPRSPRTSYLSSSSSSPTPPQPVFSSAGQNDLKQEPDPDTIKMFVGQIPKDWGEDECRQLLQEFGEIYRLNILKDKRTGASRGTNRFIMIESMTSSRIRNLCSQDVSMFKFYVVVCSRHKFNSVSLRKLVAELRNLSDHH